MPSFTSVLFDLDGTLVDSLADLRQSVNHVLGHYGYEPLSSETVRSYVGDGVRVLLARSFLGWNETTLDAQAAALAHSPNERSAYLDEREAERRRTIKALLERAWALEHPPLGEAIDRFREYYAEHHLDATRCYEGVLETLAELARRGVSMGVVSNKPESNSAAIVAELGMAEYLPVVIGGDTAGASKPDAAPVRAALERLDSDPTTTLMVGDSVNDVLSGRGAGCVTAMVSYGLSEPSLVRAYEPQYEFERFGDILKVVLSCRR